MDQKVVMNQNKWSVKEGDIEDVVIDVIAKALGNKPIIPVKLIMKDIPNNITISKIIMSDNRNRLFIILSDSTINMHIYLNVDDINDFCNTTLSEVYKSQNHISYITPLTETTFASYPLIDNNIYYIEHSDKQILTQIIDLLE